MDATRPTDDSQTALWNGTAGNAWVDAQAILDQLFQPFEDLLAQTTAECQARAVLDVGCGTGGTTVAVARVAGHATGIDISAPMLAAAQARAAREQVPAQFILADAQTHAFAPASFDLIVSRFGVMFFDDPVRAFANLRQALRPSGALRVIAWRSAAENPFMTTAEQAAAPLLPELPQRQPNAPGQFAFANAARVEQILKDSGWHGISLQPIDVTCTFAKKDLLTYITRLGPLGRILPDLDESRRKAIIDAVRPAFEPYVHGETVRLDVACWMIEAEG